MAVSKLSQIATLSGVPALTSQLVAVTNGSVDNLFSLQQVQEAIVSPAGSVGSLQYNNNGSLGAVPSYTNGSSITTIGNSSISQLFAVYNTVDDINNPTNYERVVVDWTTNPNVCTIGTQNGGTGSPRDLWITTAFNNIRFYENANYMLRIYAGGPYGFLLDSANTTFINFGTSFDVGIGRSSGGVLAIGNGGASSNNSGWYNYAGQAVTSGVTTYTSVSSLSNISGLSVSLQNGRTYQFEARLYVTAGGSVGGIQAAMGGTASASSIIYQGRAFSNNAIVGEAQASALGATVASAALGAATGMVEISGTMTVSATGSGTLTVEASQHSANATSTTLAAGCSLIVQDVG